MGFISVPPNLDHHHWPLQLQQSSHQQARAGDGGDGGTSDVRPPAVPPPLSSHLGVGEGGAGGVSIRPGSMVDQARRLNLPIPEPGISCPRCNSTNTKFCYYNNYNLTQPRHFCKGCRRYWTQNGALRNVPVGGGCRKNKRNNKNRSSKSPNQTMPKSLTASPSTCSIETMTNTHLPHPPSLQLPFMSPMGQYRGVGGNISSNLGGFQLQNEMGSFQLGSGSSNGNNFNNISSTGGVESWRLSFLAGFEVPNNPNLFHYQSEGHVAEAPSSSMVGIDNTQIDPPVRIEENNGLNLSRQFQGVSESSNQQPWIENTWTEFSGVNGTSSTTPTTRFL